MALLTVWLLWRRHWRITVHWLSTVAGVAVMTLALKNYTAVARPPLLDTSALGYAYPSAHASLSVAVFGFLAVAIARELRSNWHWVPYSVSVFLVVAIGFSRLYLGVHWFSDILGGWSLGLAWVALLGIAYRQHPAESISARVLAPLALGALLLVTSLYHTQRFDRELAFYKPEPAAEVVINSHQWRETVWQTLPVYRDDLEGRRTHPLNIQWLSSRRQIETHLLERGWRVPPKAGSLSLLGLFNSDASLQSLPVRDSGKGDRLLALRLWKTEYRQSGSGDPLWVGNVAYLAIDKHYRLLQLLRTDPGYADALQDFANDIEGLTSQRVQREMPAPDLPGLRWSGGVLLIGGD
jgi:membrane-associated phospholipid phosphatase